MIDFKKLAEPFAAEDIEWRIAERGKKGDGQWAKVLAYVTNRAIMDRFDNVCGPENWKNEFQQIPGAFLCGLSVRIGDEWVTKWDGAQESQVEATKGGISGAMKRAAVHWGVGRYLYILEGGWANIHEGGSHYAGKDDKKGLPAMKWDPPALPSWAVPAGTPTQPKTAAHQADTSATGAASPREAINARIVSALRAYGCKTVREAELTVKQFSAMPASDKYPAREGVTDYHKLTDGQAKVLADKLEKAAKDKASEMPTVCADCGAPITGDKCEQCGPI